MKTKILTVVLIGMSFGVNAQEKIQTEIGLKNDFIYKNGNVGIGEINPSSKLHIKGPDVWLKLQDSNSTSYANTNAGIQFNNNYATVGRIFQTGENLIIESRGSVSNLLFKTKQLERLRINKDGNVGIGEISPSSKLHIKGPDVWLKLQDSNSTSYANTNAEIQFNNNYATVGQIFQTGENLIIESRGSVSNLLFKTKQLERLRINKDENVGIGTINTGNHKLAVEGSIGAREIKVEASGWSDFVFYDNYKLPTLLEVENHIKEKGHLKDIPSAIEVEKTEFFLVKWTQNSFKRSRN